MGMNVFSISPNWRHNIIDMFIQIFIIQTCLSFGAVCKQSIKAIIYCLL